MRIFPTPTPSPHPELFGKILEIEGKEKMLIAETELIECLMRCSLLTLRLRGSSPELTSGHVRS